MNLGMGCSSPCFHTSSEPLVSRRERRSPNIFRLRATPTTNNRAASAPSTTGFRDCGPPPKPTTQATTTHAPDAPHASTMATTLKGEENFRGGRDGRAVEGAGVEGRNEDALSRLRT